MVKALVSQVISISMNADDSKSLIKKIVKNLNYAQTPSSFYTRISKSKENGVTVKNFENEIDLKIKDNREFYEVLKQYQETLIKTTVWILQIYY
ncbi:hypothetical protein QQA44_03885 [Sneathia vaginalis]|uniref:hypothetical protein n=1 Tax=Sneathia vaginalis TaxID=187101 RepID=UPI00254FFD47|nr:hypothetical protein [Sneathia vaginalis]MDK9581975.1 hypothetical protein [Sneathia vaginalis]